MNMEEKDTKYFIKRSRQIYEKDIMKFDLEFIIYNLENKENEYGGIKIILKNEDLYTELEVIDTENYKIKEQDSLEIKISKKIKGMEKSEFQGEFYIGILNINYNRYDLIRV